MYDLTIRDLEPIRVATVSHRGPYTGIGGAFERLIAWAGEHGLLGPATRMFGVYHDNPTIVPAAELRSEACLLVGPEIQGDATVSIEEIPGGRHAVVRYQGPYEELDRVYRWLYQGWLPQSGETPTGRPCFQEYLNNPQTLPPAEWLTLVCLPLA